ncbi:MAG: hypothetical protein P0107_01450 [Nitrosomonas sp.]|nr:hypothetical protein [Nitrosomonas sp.]
MQEASVERVASVPVTARGEIHAEVVVLGAGPGGYTAFRAADHK